MYAVNSLKQSGDITNIPLINNELMLNSFIKICDDPYEIKIITMRKLILQRAWKEKNQYLKDTNNVQLQINY